MEFKILSKDKGYEIWYLDEFNNGGMKWKKVIWDTESYCHFKDTNFTQTLDEAEQKAAEFKEKYEEEHGILIEKFSL
jgi:hypothetical protein